VNSVHTERSARSASLIHTPRASIWITDHTDRVVRPPPDFRSQAVAIFQSADFVPHSPASALVGHATVALE
jgi:hypothetical protein